MLLLIHPYYSFMLQSVCCCLTWNHNKILISSKPCAKNMFSFYFWKEWHILKTRLILAIKYWKEFFPKPVRFQCRPKKIPLHLLSLIKLAFLCISMMLFKSFLVELSYINQLNKGLSQKTQWYQLCFYVCFESCYLKFHCLHRLQWQWKELNWIVCLWGVLLF